MATTVFGCDLNLAYDLDPLMSALSDDDPRVVAQACLRRLQTPRGGIWYDDEDYGLDLREFLRLPTNALGGIPSRIDGELRKDERVRNTSTQVQVINNGLLLNIHVESELGPFSLTGPISDDDVRIQVIV